MITISCDHMYVELKAKIVYHVNRVEGYFCAGFGLYITIIHDIISISWDSHMLQGLDPILTRQIIFE